MPARKPTSEIAGKTRVIASIGGEEYELAPIKVSDWGELDGLLKRDAINLLLSVGQSINPTIVARTLSTVTQTIYDDAELFRALANPKYARWIVVRSIERAGRKLPKDALDDAPMQDLSEAAMRVLIITGLARVAEGEEKNPTDRPTGGS